VYEGTVTKVSVAGTSSGGVTTYPVTIRIDETEGLMPGMNVDATIELSSASGVLAIPAAPEPGEHGAGDHRLPQRRQRHRAGAPLRSRG
jgi:multidrug efflux pump subunit AcrA (membrane-fusion protein)